MVLNSIFMYITHRESIINFQVPMVFKIKHVNLQNVWLNFDFWPLS